MARPLQRSAGFASLAVPLVLVVTLSACGDDDDSAAAGTVVEIKPSTYVVTPTTAAGGSADGSAPAGSDGGSAGEQTYEIESGDNLSAIASDYGITIDAIANFNNWSDGSSHLLVPGETIRIPPGADVPSADEEEPESTEDDADAGSGDDEADTTEEDGDAELCPDGSRQGTYTIKETDTSRTGVAERLDVTVDQLDDANSNTPGYRAFFAGLEIVVPCSGETSDTTG